jgi:hypothetical protein
MIRSITNLNGEKSSLQADKIWFIVRCAAGYFSPEIHPPSNVGKAEDRSGFETF